MSDLIRYEVEGGIATLTIARPEKRNAMTFDMLELFNQTVERAGKDEAARVLIVTGSGGSFMCGHRSRRSLLAAGLPTRSGR